MKRALKRETLVLLCHNSNKNADRLAQDVCTCSDSMLVCPGGVSCTNILILSDRVLMMTRSLIGKLLIEDLGFESPNFRRGDSESKCLPSTHLPSTHDMNHSATSPSLKIDLKGTKLQWQQQHENSHRSPLRESRLWIHYRGHSHSLKPPLMGNERRPSRFMQHRNTQKSVNENGEKRNTQVPDNPNGLFS